MVLSVHKIRLRIIVGCSVLFSFPDREVLKQQYLQSDHIASTDAISYADQEDKDTIPASISIRSAIQLHSK